VSSLATKLDKKLVPPILGPRKSRGAPFAAFEGFMKKMPLKSLRLRKVVWPVLIPLRGLVKPRKLPG